MKPLTNEAVAKALGWYAGKVKGQWWNWKRPSDHMPLNDYEIPHFTTSLDAIVGEIEARKLAWAVGSSQKDTEARVGKTFDASKTYFIEQAKTAPLALCHALLAYLKVNP